jgi:MarR family transcriptional regulator, lower aerobic nicotinate degradation pathway regulator
MTELAHLVTQWEEFCREQPDGTVTQFAQWVLEKPLEPALTNHRFKATDPEFDKFSAPRRPAMQAGYLISKLNQYLVLYTKPLMKKNGLHSIDDFGYLQIARFYSPVTKTHACEIMMQELTTGMDIMKRLLKHGFLYETVNTADKREKLLHLTEKGEQVLNNLQHDFIQLPDTLGHLSETDRQLLVDWLTQLDGFHDEVVKEMRRQKHLKSSL